MRKLRLEKNKRNKINRLCRINKDDIKGGGIVANQKYDQSFRMQMETEFVTNYDATIRGMSRIYGVSESTLKKWKGDEGWDAKREQHKNEIVSAVSTDIAEKKIEQLTKIHNVAVGAVEYWLSMYDAETEEGQKRLMCATTGEIKLIKELMQVVGNAGSLNSKVINLTQNNINGMSDEQLDDAIKSLSKEIEI